MSTSLKASYAQMIENTEGGLDPLSFLVGAAMTTGNPALAIGIVLPLPVNIATDPVALGTKAASDVTLEAHGAAAGGGNDELEINFQ